MKKSYWNIIAAACLWGCIGLFLKLAAAAGLTSMQGAVLLLNRPAKGTQG